MRFPLLGLIRLTALGSLALGAFAVGVGRMNPPTTAWRTPAAVGQVGLPCYVQPEPEGTSSYIDLSSGTASAFEMSRGEDLQNASFSPWRDSAGRSQVVGCWKSSASWPHQAEVGLARYSFPDGEALDHVVTDTVPSGLPAWFPDRTSRVLFAGGDWQLYRLDFEPSGGANASEAAGGALSPRAVEWPVLPAGADGVLVSDPSWPAVRAIGGRVLVSLSTRHRVGGRDVFGRAKLWWLRLDRDGKRVEALGRVTAPGSASDGDETDERLPTLGRSPSGAPLLAYLSRTRDALAWRIRVAPLRLDPESGAPSADLDASRVVAADCAPVAPAFSHDGRWLVGTRKADKGQVVPCRIPLAPDDRGD